MKKYRFPLKALKMVREQHYNAASIDYSNYNKYFNDQVKLLESEKENLEKIHIEKNHINKVTCGHLINVSNYVNFYATDVKVFKEKVDNIREILTSKRTDLITKNKAKKIMENLWEKDFQKYKREAIREEVKFFDEISPGVVKKSQGENI